MVSPSGIVYRDQGPAPPQLLSVGGAFFEDRRQKSRMAVVTMKHIWRACDPGQLQGSPLKDEIQVVGVPVARASASARVLPFVLIGIGIDRPLVSRLGTVQQIHLRTLATGKIHLHVLNAGCIGRRMRRHPQIEVDPRVLGVQASQVDKTVAG